MRKLHISDLLLTIIGQLSVRNVQFVHVQFRNFKITFLCLFMLFFLHICPVLCYTYMQFAVLSCISVHLSVLQKFTYLLIEDTGLQRVCIEQIEAHDLSRHLC